MTKLDPNTPHDIQDMEFLIIDGTFRVAGDLKHNDDGSITADVYRNPDDYRAGRAMERAVTFAA